MVVTKPPVPRDIETFETAADEVRAENRDLLAGFERWLADSGLKEKTIRKHLGNVEFYLDHYLLYYGLTPAAEGATAIDGFFTWFFPRKAVWSSQAAVKENVASLKKFYMFIFEAGLTQGADYFFLRQSLKEDMPAWLAQYEDDDVW